MAPDFEYFIRFRPWGTLGHTFPGVFLLDLPVSLLVLWQFHAYAKEPLYMWLPDSVRQRIRLGPLAMPVKDAKQFALVCLSILIGVATHIVWDSFTHPSLWLYDRWQFLRQTVVLPFGMDREVARVIQHVSSVFGVVVLVFWLWNWYRVTAPIPHETAVQPITNRRAALLAVSIVALAAAILQGFLIYPHGRHWHFSLGWYSVECGIITAITIFWLGVVLYGVYTRGHVGD